MDKYAKLICIKGLIMSMDEQLNMHFHKDGLTEQIRKVITDKYYDAVLEQLDETEKAKEDHHVDNFVIKVNGVSHAFFEQKISSEQVVALTNLELTGNEILTITYSHGAKNKPTGILEVNESIQVKDKMIFNIVETSAA